MDSEREKEADKGIFKIYKFKACEKMKRSVYVLQTGLSMLKRDGEVEFLGVP